MLFEHIACLMGYVGLVYASYFFRRIFGTWLSAMLFSWGLSVLFEHITHFVGSLGVVLLLFENIAHFMESVGLV